ncbi:MULTISPECIES: PEP-CTERM sorting domain-containing protein [unclassified Nitrosomonas]|uniref:PEP-CTERM sorting domain-containing protein n=1 Tax=Nitrosomonas sp. Nm84 TaxID=200124 RepID=UPI001404322B
MDINNHGQIIGTGDHGDIRNTAFLLSYTPDTIFDPQPIFIPGPPPPPPIPEPTTWLMLLVGLELIGFMRVKKNT